MANQSIKAAFERLWQHTVLAIDKATVKVDTTLSQEGKAADAKAVGEALAGKQPIGNYIKTINGEAPDENGNIEVVAGAAEQIQANWKTTDATDPSYIKNKPFGDTANGIKHLDNKYLDFMERKSYFTIDPQQLDYELVVESTGATFWQTNKSYSISQSEWEELAKLASDSKSVVVKVNDSEYLAPLNVSTTDDNGNPTIVWFGDTYTTEYPFLVMLSATAQSEETLFQESNVMAAMPEYNNIFGYTTNAYRFDLYENCKYTVVWDDVSYEATGFVADNFKKGAIAIGNGGNIGYPGDEVPFLIVETYKSPNHEICIFAVNDTEPTHHSIKIIQHEQTLFQGLNWVAYDLLTDDTRKVGLSEQEISFNELNSQFGGYMSVLSPAPCAIRPEKRYTIVWDGVEYPVTGQDVSALVPSGIAVGDGRAFGYNGNGEPFIILYYSILPNLPPMLVFLSLVDAAPAAHTITIYEEDTPSAEFGVHTGTAYTWKIKESYLPSDLVSSVSWNDLQDKPFEETANSIKYLDNKYLEFIETSNGSTEIIPEQEISLFVNDNGDGTYSYTGGYINYDGENIGTKDESFYNEMLKLQVGKEYIITYNGKEYKYSAIDVRGEIEESGFTAPIAIGLGNPVGILTEEHPIGVTVVNMVMSAGVQYAKMAALNVLASENSEPIISTFGIREASSSKIKKEYLPDDIGGSVNPDTLKFKSIILESSTEGSSKCFKITIDDTGTLSVEEIGG